MSVEQIIFYAFSAILVFSALRVITVRNSVKAVMYLVLCFFTAAGIWMLLEAEFLAITLVLVYVGAVMVLFLFVVMMLDVDYAAMRQGYARYMPLGLLVAGGFFAALIWAVRPLNFGLEKFPEPAKHPADYSNVEELGMVLYSDYFYAFEIAAVLLLLAIIAAISLTFRGRQLRKGQDVDRQVKVKKSDRLKVVPMDAESTNLIQGGDIAEDEEIVVAPEEER